MSSQSDGGTNPQVVHKNAHLSMRNLHCRSKEFSITNQQLNYQNQVATNTAIDNAGSTYIHSLVSHREGDDGISSLGLCNQILLTGSRKGGGVGTENEITTNVEEGGIAQSTDHAEILKKILCRGICSKLGSHVIIICNQIVNLPQQIILLGLDGIGNIVNTFDQCGGLHLHHPLLYVVIQHKSQG